MNSSHPDLEHYFETAHLRRNLGQRTVRGGALMMAANGVRFALETARIVVLARLLLPADYGLVAMVTVITGLIGMFQDLGLGMATVTRETITHAQVSTLFWINALIGLGLVLLTAAIAPALGWFYDEPRVVAIALVLAPSFLFGALSVQHQALLRRQMRFGVLSSIRVFSVAVGLAVGIAMAFAGARYWALVGMTIASAAASAVALWVASRWRPSLPVRGSGARAMVVFGGHITGMNVVSYLSTRVDQALLGWWWGAAPLGLYNRATSLVEMPLTRTTTPVTSVIVPSLSRLQAQPERYRAAYLRVLAAITLITMPAATFLLGCAHWLIPFLLGPKWVEASPIFGTLAVLGFLRPIGNSARWLFITQDRASEAFRWSLFGAIMRSLAVVAGLPWGGFGVAVTTVAWALLRTPVLIWYVTRRGPIRAAHIYRALAAPALAAAGALLVVVSLWPLAEGQAPGLVVAAGLATTAVTFGGIIFALPAGRRTISDVTAMLRSFRRDRRIL